MSQSPIAHLENEDEDFLIVPEDSSPVSQRKLKRLKRVALQSPQEQNLVSERNGEKQTVFESELTKLGPGLEDMSANELTNNDLEFNAASQGLNKREREDAGKQNITHENSYNSLDEVQKASHDKKDNAVEDEVAKNHERGESSKGKKNLRETSTTEETKGKKKSRKDSATTEERESSKAMKNLRKTSTTEEVKGKEKSKKDFDTTDVRELGKCKKDSREFSITEEIKGKKKSRKIAVTTKEYAADATNELHAREGKAVSSLLEKKKKKKLESSSTPLDKEMEDAGSAPGKRGQKKKNKDELEEIHAESQRLLRETRDASFKPQPVVGKSISSVLEKIRFRKIQLEQKAGKGLDGMQKNSSGSEGHSEGLSDESDNMEFENDDEDNDGAMQEDHHMENEGYNSEEVNCSIPPVNDSGIPRTPENYTETSLSEKGPKQDVPKINDGFRAPVEDTQDLFCNSQLSYGEDEVENPLDSTQEEEILAPALLSMNLKLDSHPQEDDLSDEDDNKENVDPSPSKPVEAPVYSKAAPVKAFVDDEAEDEDEDILVGQDEEDASDADENEDLQDIMATAEEEHPIDHERREELHRKWLEQQDAAATGDILLRLRSGWKQRDSRGWKTSVLDEEDDVDFVSQEDDIMECDDEPVHYRPVPEPAKHANDSSNLEKLSWETTIDKDDVLESSDDEELEQRLLRQRILKESEEQEVFMGPAEDESSREVFGLIKKVNVASISKKKTKPASTFLETLYSGGNSNNSLKSSFLGRPTSSSLQSSHKHGLCGSRSYIFGRDDSNSRHGTSKTGSQGDSVFELQDQKENDHSTDARKKRISTEGKAKNSESAHKKANNTNDSSAGPSLFEILKRQTSEMDRTLQSRNTNTIQEYRQTHTISHFAAFKSSISAKIVKKAG